MSCVPVGFRSLPIPITQLSLAAVLKCGQSFRWQLLPLHSTTTDFVQSHEYRFCLNDRVIFLRQSKDALFYQSIHKNTSNGVQEEEHRDKETVAFLRDYFQLDVDLLDLYDDWSRRDPVFRSFRDRFSGIRMLRQDPWENVVSFICSANNNISRISKMVQNLCTHFSPLLVTLDTPTDALDATKHTYHPFPPPSALALPSVSAKLRALGFGYRAEYIQKTASILLEAHGSDEAVHSWLKSLRELNTADARTELLKLMGIGRKVADCILLMSLDKPEVVPVDTHVHQIAVKHYDFRSGGSKGKVAMTPKLYDAVNEKLCKIWGSYAGWAHSVLFTADLKSFTTFGLPTPVESPLPTPTPTRKRKNPNVDSKEPVSDAETRPASSATPNPKRRKKRESGTIFSASVGDSNVPVAPTTEDAMVGDTLAERVKNRRRVSRK